MDVINLADKLSQFTDAWSPKIVGEINDMHVKVAKLRGEFVWHHHDREDELFLVVCRPLAEGYAEHRLRQERADRGGARADLRAGRPSSSSATD
jgi:hypothetical protein